MSKSDWVKVYMTEHSCSKQAAYKAWGKVNHESTSQPESKPSQPESTDLRIIDLVGRVAMLTELVKDLTKRVEVLESRPTLAMARELPGASISGSMKPRKQGGDSAWGKSSKLIPRG